MTLPVDELHRELSPDEVKASLYAIQDALGLSTSSWVSGSVVRVLNAAVSHLGSGFTRLVTTLNRSAFLDTARGGWLSLRVRDTYGEEAARQEATFARGELRVDNTAGGIYAFDPGELVVQNSVTRATFSNVAPFAIAAQQLGVVGIFEATEIGAASTSAPNQVDAVVTAALGLTVNNPDALVGLDEEEDEELVVRARESSGRLSPNGPRDAYAFTAKSSTRNGRLKVFDPNGVVIDVNRVLVSSGQNPVIVRIASAQGAVAGDKDIAGTDVWAIQQAIDRYVVPHGIEAEVYSATQLPLAVKAEVFVRKRISALSPVMEAAVANKLTRFLSTAPIGGWVLPGQTEGFIFRNMVVGIIESLELEGIARAEDYVIKADVFSPAADVPVPFTHVPIAGPFVIKVTQV